MLCPVSRLSFLSLFSIDRMMQNWWTCCTNSKTAVTVVWPSLVVVPSGSSTWMSRSSKVRAQLGWSRGGWRWEGSVWCMVTHSSICRVSLSLVLLSCAVWDIAVWLSFLGVGFISRKLCHVKQTFVDVQKTHSTVWFCNIIACTFEADFHWCAENSIHCVILWHPCLYFGVDFVVNSCAENSVCCVVLSHPCLYFWSRLLLMCRKPNPLCGFVTSLLVLWSRLFSMCRKLSPLQGCPIMGQSADWWPLALWRSTTTSSSSTSSS